MTDEELQKITRFSMMVVELRWVLAKLPPLPAEIALAAEQARSPEFQDMLKIVRALAEDPSSTPEDTWDLISQIAAAGYNKRRRTTTYIGAGDDHRRDHLLFTGIVRALTQPL